MSNGLTREFLMHCTHTYHNLSWCVSQQILSSRLEKKYTSGIKSLILERLRSYEDPTHTVGRFLEQHQNDDLAGLMQEMDIVICIRLLLDRELAILPEKKGRDLLYELRQKRNEGLSHWANTSLTLEESSRRYWDNNHRNLMEVAEFFRKDISDDIYGQILAYHRGDGAPYQPPVTDPFEKIYRRLSSGSVWDLLNALVDSTGTQLADNYGSAGPLIDEYIAKGTGGAERTEKAIRQLAGVEIRYAFLLAERMDPDKAVDYLMSLNSTFPGHLGEIYDRVADVTAGKQDAASLAQARTCRRFALYAGSKTAKDAILREIGLHMADLERWPEEEWMDFAAQNLFIITFLPEADREPPVRKHSRIYLKVLEKAAALPPDERLAWLRNDTAPVYALNAEAAAARKKLIGEISRDYWRGKLESLQAFVQLPYPHAMDYVAEDAYTSLMRTDSDEYARWYSVYMPFDRRRQYERRCAAREQIAGEVRALQLKADLEDGFVSTAASAADAGKVIETKIEACKNLLPEIDKRIAGINTASAEHAGKIQQLIQQYRYFLPDDADEAEKQADADMMEKVKAASDSVEKVRADLTELKKSTEKRIRELEKQLERQKKRKKRIRTLLILLALALLWLAARTAVAGTAGKKADKGELLDAYSLLDRTSVVLALEKQRAETLHDIRLTLLENGYRRDTGLPEKPRFTEELSFFGLAEDTALVPSSNFTAYKVEDGSYYAAWGNDGIPLHIPGGRELTDIWSSSFAGSGDLLIRAYCADGTILRGYVDNADPDTLRESGIDFTVEESEQPIRELVWLNGSPCLWLEDNTLCNENFIPLLYEVARFDGNTPLREDFGHAWSDSIRESDGRAIWEANSPFYTVTVDGHLKQGDYNDQLMRWESGGWKKSNDWLFADGWQPGDALNVYDSEVEELL